MATRQRPLLVTADLARSDPSGLLSQALPFADAGRAEPKRLCDGSNCLTRISTRQSALPNIFRIGPCHPCWPPLPSRMLESETSQLGNPDSDQKQRALGSGFSSRDGPAVARRSCWPAAVPARPV